MFRRRAGVCLREAVGARRSLGDLGRAKGRLDGITRELLLAGAKGELLGDQRRTK